MKVLFLSSKGTGGPTIWKNGIINFFSTESSINCKEFKISFFPNIREIFKGIKLIKECEVVHTYTESPSILLFLLCCKIFRKSIVYTLHGDYFVQNKSKYGWKKLFWIPANDYCLMISSTITVPSKYLLTKICKKRKFIHDKIVVVPNGIDINETKYVKSYSKKELGLDESIFLILEITNLNYLEKAKGLVPLIEGFKHFNEKYPFSTLWIIGDGRYFAYYSSKYSSDTVRFLGRKERSDVLRLIRTSDLIIHSTFLDNFPYVILEAMICGKPIISTNTGGIPELLGDAGIIIDPNPYEFELQLTIMYEDIKLRNDLGKNAFDRAMIFDWHSVANSFISLYSRILSEQNF